MLPQNPHHGRSQNHQFPTSYMPGDQQLPQDSYGIYNNPSLEKQMAALSAASLAKMANRSAPGSAQSPNLGQSASPYFGGNSLLALDRSDSGPHDFSSGFSQSAPPIPPNNPISFQDPPSMANNRPNPAPTQQQLQMQKRRQFLHGIGTVMAQRNTPLPPALTGFPYPQHYDPNSSPWKMLEISPSEPGSIRIAGKDVDLYKLWGIVYQHGGGMKFNQQNAWYNILPVLDLPEQLPPPNQGSTANFIGQLYMALISPFEEIYRKNTQAQMHKAAAAAGRQFPPPGTSQPIQQPPPQNRPQPGVMGGGAQSGFPVNMLTNTQNMNLVAQAMAGVAPDPSLMNNMNSYPNPQPEPSPHRNQQHMVPQSTIDGRPSIQSHPSPESMTSLMLTSQQVRPPSRSEPLTVDTGISGVEPDNEHKKRKMSEEDDGKRIRQKTGEPPEGATPSSGSASGSLPAPSAQPPGIPRTRRKISYIPLAREVDTMGGRNITTIGPELQRVLQHRPLKSIHEWGMVDIEALIMSIRSRLASELSYALTTCSLLSVVRDSGKDVPYLTVSQCPDLFDELLDLMEEVAFKGMEEVDEFEGCEDDEGATLRITTMRELVNLIQEHETKPFASLDPNRPGVRNPDLGPTQRPGDVILAVVNIMRNWAAACTENLDFMARHPTMLSVILRISGVASRRTDPTVRPASPVLSLSDLITIRKDVLYILFGVTAELRLKGVYEKSPVVATRMTRRILELVSSSLIDPIEICAPSAHPTVPYIADNALQVWTRFSQPDDHRKIICRVIPQHWLWQLFQVLVYRLPVTARDYEVITKDTWLTYVEKLMMAIYSLAFLAPPELKHKVKTDKRLGFPGLMLRMVRRFITNPNQNVREFFSVCARRAIETMKLVDDEEDMFDTAPTTTPVLSFGVGHGEGADKSVEKGSGMLSGYADDVTYTIMLAREVDNMMFGELESMVRVEF